MITWRMYIDFDKTELYDHPLSDVTNRVMGNLSWTGGFTNPIQVESNPSAHVSPSAQLSFTLDNRDGALAYENVGADFYQLLYSGLLVKLEVTFAEVTHTFIYYTKGIQDTPGRYGQQQVIVMCECVMSRVQQINYEPEIATDVTTSAAITAFLEAGDLMLPYTSSYFFIDATEIDSSIPIFDPATDVAGFTDFETGFTTIEYVGDISRRDQKDLPTQKGLPYVFDVCMAEGFGRFFYQPRDGLLHYHHRYHDKVTSSSLTLSATQYTAARPIMTDVYNEIRVHYTPREIGNADTVLFDSQQVPIALPVEGEKSIRVNYRDEDNKGVTIAALSINDIVLGDDLLAETNDNQPISNGIKIDTDLKGIGGGINIVNRYSESINVTLMRVKGTPIYTYDAQIAEARGGQSIFNHNWKPLPDIRANYITDDEFAQAVADFLLLRHQTPRRVFESVTVVVTEDNFIDFAGVTIGDVITIEEDWSGHNSEYVVTGEWHQYNIAIGQYQVTWYLRRSDTTPYFIIDTSYIDGDDIIGY